MSRWFLAAGLALPVVMRCWLFLGRKGNHLVTAQHNKIPIGGHEIPGELVRLEWRRIDQGPIGQRKRMDSKARGPDHVAGRQNAAKANEGWVITSPTPPFPFFIEIEGGNFATRDN